MYNLEKFKEKYLEFIYDPDCIKPGYSVARAFSLASGEVSSFFGIPNPEVFAEDQRIEYTKEDRDAFQKLFEDIISEFPHVEFEKVLSWRENGGGRREMCINPKFENKFSEITRLYLGTSENIILECGWSSNNKDYACNIILDVHYTASSIKSAKGIYERYLEMMKSRFKEKMEEGREGEEKYNLRTMLLNNGGTRRALCVKKITCVTRSSLSSPEFYENYNEDLPIETITKFLKSQEGGIMIFNGNPGTGKSSFLKHLIQKHRSVKFVVVPQEYIQLTSEFRDFIMDNISKEYVFIVEDCEKLLMSRENKVDGGAISEILNATDGILGDLTNTKFIFTFNTGLKNIDKAILRRGRLKLKYEFSPLKGKNLEKVSSRIGITLTNENKEKGMTLADLYSGLETIEYVSAEKRIGF